MSMKTMSMLCILSVCLLCSFHLQAVAENSTVIDSTEQGSLCKKFEDLENALLCNETNKIALSLTFFPLEDNPPEFVRITYDFGNSAQHVWFWSARSSHFLHPFEVFQFMSLLFSKPEPYYTGNLNVTLPPECANITSLLPNGKPRLQLLTQRVSKLP